MLNAETKRKIQGLRDTLVGKIPVPTDQVKQITLGLIYKFMSDIDRENTDILGGKSFFNGDYQRYSWNNIIDKSLSSYERVTLYSEGLEKMSLNPNIPELFRDIFRNAYLPFRDPATLSQFLIGINEFNYDHSEDLGDAFEFLLSVMGSQGDAGQFRTPRHIIDFIVKVVEPKKTDKILDPACGTAGFLISAYKYILDNNKTSDSDKSGSALSLTEKNKLTENFVGYDISTDMVRLSLVNMYLHNFANPNIKEYDTLTSEDLWDEDFDCIMANPPFMTPKGGIRPHKRFAIRANRSEVLFVDYIAEHLMPNGKAGVIVPEGIIFQSSNAYKALRKMLVEDNYLYAVVSLPAGVFQPYSGVKTSILFMDKNIAGRTNEILFVKIENDGFDLGAQRREIDRNDLPLASGIIKKYKSALRDGKDFEINESEKQIAQLVAKDKTAESGDYNLSGNRYEEVSNYTNQKWPIVELGDSCTFEYGKPLTESNRKNGKHPVFGSNGVVGYHNEYLVKGPFIIVGRKGTAGAVNFSEKDGFPIDTTFYIKLKDRDTINLKYLFHIMSTLNLGQVNIQSGVPGLNRNDAYKIKIPLPPLEIQQEILKELNEYQKIIDGAKQVVENYKPKIEIDPNWNVVELSELCEIKGGKRLPKGSNFYNHKTEHPYLRVIDFKNNSINFNNLKYIDNKIFQTIKNYTISKNDIYISIAGSIGIVGMIPESLDRANLTENAAKLIIENDKTIIKDFLTFILSSAYCQKQIHNLTMTVGVPKLALKRLAIIKIPLPLLNEQSTIVSNILEERKTIESNKKLIEIYEKKIGKKISGI